MNDICVRFRIAGTQDAELLSGLGARAFSQAFAADNSAEDMTEYLAASFSIEKQTAELSEIGSVFIIAEVSEEAVGYARLLGGSIEACVTGSRPVELVRIYVLKNWISKGVGSALMQACLDESRERGYDTIWLGVWEKNLRAIAFYQKWGFSQVGLHSFQLGQDIQQDWVMQRSLG